MDATQCQGATVMRRGSYDEAAASLCTHQLRSLAQRRRSAPALAFGKALGMPWSPIREEPSCWVTLDQCPFVVGLSSENGELLLDECVQVTEGTKTRDRHLFLFSDVIIFAKLKSSASYRLKHRVSLQDVWLYSFDDEEDPEDEEDERGDIDLRITLMLAWALNFCLVSFRSPEVKERWLDTLHRKIKEAKERTGCTSPPSLLMKVLSGSMIATKTGGGMEPFIGFPLEGDAKISALPMKALHHQDDRLAQQPIENGGSKWNILRSVGRRKAQSESRTQLFGQPLARICPEEGQLPKPITVMLALLWKKGPSTEGVFRKPCNNRTMKLVRDQLNLGEEVDMDDMNVANLVGLLKSFLKDLPGSLLVSDLYDSWMEALDTEDAQQRAAHVKRVVDMLPGPNRLLLRHVLSVLCRVLESADTNKMDAANLATCIAPTLLQLDAATVPAAAVVAAAEQLVKLNKVTELTRFLMENCDNILGENVSGLLGDIDDDSLSSQQHDSAYDSPGPDADGEARGSSSSLPSRPYDATAAFRKPAPFNRRCSEPIISPTSAVRSLRSLTRSQEDCTQEREQPLKKPVSDDSFLLRGRGGGGGATVEALPWNAEPALYAAGNLANLSKDCSHSSSCSLESNQSEGSVFTGSPPGSPACVRRANSTRQAAPSGAKDDAGKDVEVKKRSHSMKVPLRPKFSFSRGSVKKSQKERPFTTCGTLPEDSQSEGPEAQTRADNLVKQRRPLSAIEVFQQVDARLPCRPPTYEHAVQSAALPAPPQYRTMTVQVARELGRRSRPSSVNGDFASRYAADCFAQTPAADAADGVVPPYRPRAMSESVSGARPDAVSRRCSQQLPFEDFSYAKESYV